MKNFIKETFSFIAYAIFMFALISLWSYLGWWTVPILMAAFIAMCVFHVARAFIQGYRTGMAESADWDEFKAIVHDIYPSRWMRFRFYASIVHEEFLRKDKA